MKEIWKDIQGYEGLYQISNFGNVWSIQSNKILKTFTTRLGYIRVSLTKDKVRKNHSIHRLVAKAFIPNPNGYPQINHKDENPGNNHVDNLEWCTAHYNINYGHHNKRISLRSNHVIQTELDGTFIAEYASVPIAAKFLNLKPSTIYECCNHGRPYAYGYVWNYVYPNRS